ncbi:hypothetical protein HZS54_11110 [Halosimplex pelagicum]|uniref:Uncharacterized protein n=1 Tax=Halosimplex pelagicum TaxID=869886 RepID=A0A7D5P6J9_9EURY|nr:hypothetical protein HZS54_11110 [Halosimplex pelagicum]
MSESADLTSFSQTQPQDGDEDDPESEPSPPEEGENGDDSSDEYGTPRWLIRRLQEALVGSGRTLFDLDPTSGAEPLQIAEMRYTKQDDGLQQPWALPAVNTIYLNPPYSDPEPFLRKLKQIIDPDDPDAPSLGISLTKSDTSGFTTTLPKRGSSVSSILAYRSTAVTKVPNSRTRSAFSESPTRNSWRRSLTSANSTAGLRLRRRSSSSVSMTSSVTGAVWQQSRSGNRRVRPKTNPPLTHPQLRTRR